MSLHRLSATFLAGLVMATASVATGCSSSTDTPISGETSGASPAVSTQLEGASSAPPGEATTTASTSSASFPMEAAVGIAESKEQFASMSLAEATQLMGLLGHPDSVQELVAGLAVDFERRDEVAPAGLKLRVAVIETS